MLICCFSCWLISISTMAEKGSQTITNALTTASRQSGWAFTEGQLNTNEWGKLVWAVPLPHMPLYKLNPQTFWIDYVCVYRVTDYWTSMILQGLARVGPIGRFQWSDGSSYRVQTRPHSTGVKPVATRISWPSEIFSWAAGSLWYCEWHTKCDGWETAFNIYRIILYF
jgi:hypothetical protein